MKTVDWEKPQRQSPIVLLIILLEGIKQIWPWILLGLLRTIFKSKDEAKPFDRQLLIVLISSFLVLVLIKTKQIINYFTFRFRLQQNLLLVEKGIFTKVKTEIPFGKIQAIHQNQKQQNNYLSDSLNTFETNLLQQYQTHHFTESTNQQTLKNVLHLQGKKIFRIDASGVYLKNHKPDILWLTQSPKINLDRLITETKPKQIVADGSNYPSFVQRWKQTCLQKNIPFHATAEKGYYKID